MKKTVQLVAVYVDGWPHRIETPSGELVAEAYDHDVHYGATFVAGTLTEEVRRQDDYSAVMANKRAERLAAKGPSGDSTE